MKHLNLLAFVIFSLAVVWVFMFSSEAKRRIQRPILSVFGIVSKAGNAISVDEDIVNGVNIAPEALAEKYTEEELSERYSYLLRDVMHLRAIKSQYSQIQRDNAKLRNSLGFMKRTKLEGLVPARVIKRESATWWKELLINKGESSGLVLDSPVLTTTPPVANEDAKPALIGKVVGLSENTARVLLLTDERCKVAARIRGTLESGLLMGSRVQDGTPILKLRYLSKNPKELESNPQSPVYSSDAGGVVPRNFLLGTIQSFESREFYGEATVKPAVDFAQLTEVFVLLPRDEDEVIKEAEAADAAGAAAAPKPRQAIPVTGEPEPEPEPEIPPRAAPTGGTGQ